MLSGVGGEGGRGGGGRDVKPVKNYSKCMGKVKKLMSNNSVAGGFVRERARELEFHEIP